MRAWNSIREAKASRDLVAAGQAALGSSSCAYGSGKVFSVDFASIVGIGAGLALADVVARNTLQRGVVPAALLGLMPWRSLGPPAALFVIAAVVFATWASVLLYRRLRPATV